MFALDAFRLEWSGYEIEPVVDGGAQEVFVELRVTQS